MLSLNFPLPVKFICGFIYAQETIYEKTKEILTKEFGNIDLESSAIDFNFTRYYSDEMGEKLTRRFISFGELQNIDKFVKIKLFCIELERRFAVSDKRIINIDPGYLNESKLVLLTTKDYYHRIYLGQGIYSEVTLYYQKGSFCDFTTTYPDFRANLYKKIFISIRELYCKQIGDYKSNKTY